MTDPFSAFGCVLGILSSLITLSKPVIQIVDDVRKASTDTQCLSRDIRAFFSVVRSLDIALHESEVKSIVEHDAAISCQLSELGESLRNCRDVLTSLMIKHKELHHMGTLPCFKRLKWAMFTKSEVRSLQLPLETMKSTLNSALNAATILLSMRILAVVRVPALSARRNPGEQLVDSVTSLVYQTYSSVLSDDRELSQEVIRVYQSLDDRCEQMQELRATTAHNHQSTYDSSMVDIFMDIVSRVSINGPYSFTERQRGCMLGKPDYFFETSSSYYPERFDVAAPSMTVVISAILPLPGYSRTQRYFVNFQESARRWQRVFLVVTYEDFEGASAMLQVSAVADSKAMIRQVHERLQSPLYNLCREIVDFGAVTNVFVALAEDQHGQIVADTRKITKAENMLEKHLSDENKFLQDLEHFGCPHFKESQVITPFPRTQFSLHRQKVWVEVRAFTERKIPFASGGQQGENLFGDFVEGVKRLLTLRKCSGIVQFLGIILEDSSRHIKGYLLEVSTIQDICWLTDRKSRAFNIKWRDHIASFADHNDMPAKATLRDAVEKGILT